ncbi:type I restriction-modification system subunit M [Helicobacter suis]|uniref:type I restriction-modification system subunit M n=1 Tax=Helicobacter suis TaxID=104628 RepID=UPI001596FCA2|nr:class I SAM-dependent DNA methyltransferase [Helicobacter suis]BCD50793.1 hypothetical protein NHP194022_04640 [Helicobacter suis]
MDGVQFQPIINFIWDIANLLRDHYKRGKYRDVILPMTVIRRLDAILEPTKQKVLAKYKECKEKGLLEKGIEAPLLCDASGFKFYNHSQFTLKTLLDDPENLKDNFKNYLNSFSATIKDILKKFNFETELDTLEQAEVLFKLVDKFCSNKVNFSIKSTSDKPGLSNLGMGYVFEELIRKFNEENNEEAGEHFTPRDIISLMATLIFKPISEQLNSVYFVYDNACGSGGMLTESKAFIKNLQPTAEINLYGQEVNPETYAICKADMLIKGENPENIKFGSTLSDDQFKDLKFDFMLTNPPFGKSYGNEQEKCKNDSRFAVGLTGVGDGQMMFLLNMISKMKDTPLGSRIASIHNGSALFNSDSGQVAIRSHIITKDYLEAIIALPTDLFYNTQIPTFIWILNNRKEAHKKQKVQLIDATSYFEPMAKSLGKKSKRLSQEHIDAIFELFSKQIKGPQAVVLDCEDLGYTKFNVISLKSSQEVKDDSELINKEAILKRLEQLEANPPKLEPIFKDEKTFLNALNIPIPKKTNPEGKISKDLKILLNKSEEKIPLKEDKDTYFLELLEQIRPQIGFIKGQSIKVGYEILFNQHFYRPTEAKSARTIQQEIRELEGEIQELLDEILA